MPFARANSLVQTPASRLEAFQLDALSGSQALKSLLDARRPSAAWRRHAAPFLIDYLRTTSASAGTDRRAIENWGLSRKSYARRLIFARSFVSSNERLVSSRSSS